MREIPLASLGRGGGAFFIVSDGGTKAQSMIEAKRLRCLLESSEISGNLFLFESQPGRCDTGERFDPTHHLQLRGSLRI